MSDLYDCGMDVLGARADYGDTYGPLSPGDLAKLDRALTPAEQSAVDEWQSRDADRELAAERAKGGPQSATVSVTPQGAVIKSLAKPKPGTPWWQIALGVAAAGAIGVGTYKVLRRR